MSEQQLAPVDAESAREEWFRAVTALTEQVGEWAARWNWPVERKTLDVTEELLGTYGVPMLEIQTEWGPLFLEPVARYVMGAEGRVDLYAYPSLYRVMLLRSGALPS